MTETAATEQTDPREAASDAQTDGTTAGGAPVRKSTWTPTQNLARILWMFFGPLLWSLLPFARPTLLRAFGATVGKGCRFGPAVQVAIPWNLDIGDRVSVRSHAILYALGPVKIGSRSTLDHKAHLCAGTHDASDPGFPLVRSPITVGSDCLLGVDSFVAPGVTVGDGATLLPRASAHRDVPPGATKLSTPSR
ncbi:MAG: DapH/DapD/GlmU-related protein, partial [Planctomycetota bacterium]